VTGDERPPDPRDDLRYPDSRPLRRLQLATLALIAVAALVTLLSGSRPAEVRWGTLIGLVALIAVVLWAARRRRGRRGSREAQNSRNAGE
jgi:hypothetical protein